MSPLIEPEVEHEQVTPNDEGPPWYFLGNERFRNGREAGMHAAGLHVGCRAGTTRYTIKTEWQDGFVTAVVQLGLRVRIESWDADVTMEISG